MRSIMLAAALFASTSVLAIEPALLPRMAENAAAETVKFNPHEDIVAEGVPVEAVLSGAEAPSGWVAGAGGQDAALGGLDPVSFFEPGGPKRGDARFKAEYHGSVFYFAGKRQRDLFVSAPETYAPAFGGYDPEMLALGSLMPADPENWTIHEGRLFLSGSPDLKDHFDKHKPEVIKAAKEKWKAVDDMFEDRFFKAHQD
jgi:YHS domain-containing protein